MRLNGLDGPHGLDGLHGLHGLMGLAAGRGGHPAAAGEGADRNTRGRVCPPDQRCRRRDADGSDRDGRAPQNMTICQGDLR